MIEKMLQKDLLVKVAAVIIAVLVWADTMTTVNPRETKPVRVDLLLEAPEGMILRDQSVTQVTITFEGRRHSLEKVRDAEVSVPIDISEAPVGKTTRPIEYVSPYSGVTVVDIYPSQLTFTLTPKENKQVAISISTRGTPNNEFIAGSAVHEEHSATVTGPKSNVERVYEVTGEIDVTGAVAETSARVALVPRDRYGVEVDEITVEPEEIGVTVPLTQKQPPKTVPVKVGTTGNPKRGFKVEGTSVAPKQVVIRGEPSVTGDITEILARVNVDGKDAPFTASINLTVPTGVTLEDTTKVTVNVDIQPDIVTRTFSNVPVQPIDLPIGFTWEIDPKVVEEKLTGRSDILEGIKQEDVQAFINASNSNPAPGATSETFKLIVGPGTLPEGVQVNFEPPWVDLTLTKRW